MRFTYLSGSLGAISTPITADSAGATSKAIAFDGSFQILFVAPAQIGSGSPQTVAQGWDFSYMQVTDGTTTLDASVVLEPVAGGLWSDPSNWSNAVIADGPAMVA